MLSMNQPREYIHESHERRQLLANALRDGWFSDIVQNMRICAMRMVGKLTSGI